MNGILKTNTLSRSTVKIGVFGLDSKYVQFIIDQIQFNFQIARALNTPHGLVIIRGAILSGGIYFPGLSTSCDMEALFYHLLFKQKYYVLRCQSIGILFVGALLQAPLISIDRSMVSRG